MENFKKYLVAGLLVWIPVGITVWVLSLLIGIMDQSLLLLPQHLQTKAWLGVHVPGLGVFLTLVIVLATGMVAANFFGKKLLALWDNLLQRIPIVRSIYGGVKQISDTLFSPEGQAFSKAVLVQYPRAGSWTVALLTGTPKGEITNHLGENMRSVFVPTTPNITAGFFLVLPASEVQELEMSVDDALKYIISMGLAEPVYKHLAPAIANNANAINSAEMKTSGTDPNM